MKPGSLRFLAVIVVATLAVSGTAPAADVHVMISSGFFGAYSELAPAFERASGHRLVTTRGPSMGDSQESIPARLARGEAADVVILDGGATDALGGKGLLRAGSKVVLARSLIGMVVISGAAKPDIGSVEAFKSTLLAAKSIAYSDSASGVYLSTTLFRQIGVYDQIKDKARKIPAEPVAKVVARGEAEIGFQPVSELRPYAGIDIVGPIPDELQIVNVFAAGVARSAKQPEAARALIAFLVSPAAKPAIVQSGMQFVDEKK
jgi:molybdate transport system substrate-binding protein